MIRGFKDNIVLPLTDGKHSNLLQTKGVWKWPGSPLLSILLSHEVCIHQDTLEIRTCVFMLLRMISRAGRVES